MFNHVRDPLEWLGQQSGYDLFYLIALDLGFEKVGKVTYIKLMSDLARNLQGQHDFVKQMLVADWRVTLNANIVAILQGDAVYVETLVEQIVKLSWVAPQLAAGVALLSPTDTVPQLEQLVHNAAKPTDGRQNKAVLSAYAALKLLGSDAAIAFEQNPIFHEFTSNAELDWPRLVKKHYHFWTDVPRVS